MSFELGKIIREQRELRGITQEDLCYGIYEVAALSKIENGIRNPRRAKLIMLLQRLGLVADRYYGICHIEELEIENAKFEIKNANARTDYLQALLLLATFEERFEGCDDPIIKQFIYWSRAINGYLVDGEVVQYSSGQQRELLHQAITCTQPNFSIENFQKHLLALDEILIIENVANSYSKEGSYYEANLIHDQLLRYVQSHLQEVSESALIVPLIAYNYSRSLGRDSRHAECLEVSQIGIDCCKKYGKSRLMGELLINKACALQNLGQITEGRDCAIHSYYLLSAMGMSSDAQLVAKYLLETYDTKPL